mgnify:FL=1
MLNATFETFLVSGLLILIVAIGYLAWSAWRWVDRERDMEKRSLDGIRHEMRLNLKRLLDELRGVANGSLRSDIDIIPVVHPQLDALLSRPNEADRRGLTIIRGNYNELSAHKQTLRAALAKASDVKAPADNATQALIGSIATLYLWEQHKGCPPDHARTTRSWDVRDWMKATPFDAHALPGLHLRDQVVKYLRSEGMTLTPKPLTHTAHEFYAMQYDRKADPNAPFWKRKTKKEANETLEADVVDATPEKVEPETTSPETKSDPAPEPPVVEAEPLEAEAVETNPPAGEVEAIDPSSDPMPDPKPTSSGSVH